MSWIQSLGQKEETDQEEDEDSDTVEYVSQEIMYKITDSVMAIYNYRSDSLMNVANTQHSILTKSLRSFSDSISLANASKLNPIWKNKYQLYSAQIENKAESFFNKFNQDFNHIRGQGEASVKAINKFLFDDREWATDSLYYTSEFYSDSLTTMEDNFYWSYEDTVDNLNDKLLDYADYLVDNQQEVEDSLEIVEEKASKFIFGLGFMNPVNYNGRNFGVKQYSFNPEIRYRSKYGFSIYTTGYIWSGANNKLAKTDFGIDYTFNITHNWEVNVAYERWLFTNGTPEDRNSLTNAVEVYTGYDFEFLYASIFAMDMFGTENLYLFTPEISKYFEWKNIIIKKDKITFEPGVKAVFGNNYNLVINEQQKTRIGSTQTNINYNGSSFFGILDYEIMLPINYKTGPWTYTATFNEAFPQNVPPGNSASPFFYFTANISYYLKTHY